jgi:hypothetical protein
MDQKSELVTLMQKFSELSNGHMPGTVEEAALRTCALAIVANYQTLDEAERAAERLAEMLPWWFAATGKRNAPALRTTKRSLRDTSRSEVELEYRGGGRRPKERPVMPAFLSWIARDQPRLAGTH